MNGIRAYSVDETDLPGHISLYRIFPEMAVDEDGRSNIYSFDDIKELLSIHGFEHSVVVENDMRFETRVGSAVNYLQGQSDVGKWTGALSSREAMFFFERASDAIAFRLTS